MVTSRGETMKLKVILEPSEEGGYTAIVPSVPGCISEGDTKEETLRNIREAICTLRLSKIFTGTLT
jgi:predicted RNase H-like HicB family nuclease